MTFSEVKMQPDRRGRWNYKLQAITTRNVFKREQTTNKVPGNIFRFFEVRAKVRLIF